MGLRKYLRKEYACIKDDHGVTLDFVTIDRKKEIFRYGNLAYNVKRDEMYDLKIIGLVITKVIYFYNVNNPNPLNFNKTSNAFEPVISPELYNRMLENEILIKLNTLSSGIDFKKILIILGICVLGYLAWSSGIFGNNAVATNTTNTTNLSMNNTFRPIPFNESVRMRDVNLSALRSTPP
jgi:hypothetical protein